MKTTSNKVGLLEYIVYYVGICKLQSSKPVPFFDVY